MKSSPRLTLLFQCARRLASGLTLLTALGCSKGGPRHAETRSEGALSSTRDVAGGHDGAAVSTALKGPPPNLNILLITVDSLRADMPWAGYDRPIAPNLTEFEKRAVSYTRAYALSSYTSMSVGGLLGGRKSVV